MQPPPDPLHKKKPTGRTSFLVPSVGMETGVHHRCRGLTTRQLQLLNEAADPNSGNQAYKLPGHIAPALEVAGWRARRARGIGKGYVLQESATCDGVTLCIRLVKRYVLTIMAHYIKHTCVNNSTHSHRKTIAIMRRRP